MPKKINLIGQSFDRLTVLYESSIRKYNKVTWHCKCICGKEIDVTGNDLRSYKVRSCGCLQKETAHNRFKDLSGQKFGRLTVLRPLEQKTIDGHIIWKCQCDCGSIVNVMSSSLINGKTNSCGCLKSKQEENISILLNNNNIPFIKQYLLFNSLKRFDFYVNNRYIIEFDGKQHFSYQGGWNNQKQVNYIHNNDLVKNKYCFDNNIPLIRIPYCEEYTIDDLKLETTRFLLTKENEQNYYNKYGVSINADSRNEYRRN